MIVRPAFPNELRWFTDDRFGMFVDFGVYALLGAALGIRPWRVRKTGVPAGLITR